MRQYLTALILLTFLSGCAANSNTLLVNEKYTGKQNTKKEMIIFPILYDSLTVVNWDDVVDDFEVDSANSRSFIYDTLNKSLLINSKLCTRYLTIVDGKKLFDWDEMIKDKNNYLLVNQKIDDKYIPNFLVPKKELLPSDFSSSYALIIKKISIGRNIDRQPATSIYMPGQTVSTPGGSFQTPGTYSSGWSPENLGARTEFIIWDYEKNDFVKCGLAISKEDFPFGMSTLTWMDLFKTIPLDLFEDTPFGISPVNYYMSK
jgi:hypothetical protein